MDPLLFPDLFAMALLIGVLALVRRRFGSDDIRFWMRGLYLILLECVARLLYSLPLPSFWHRTLHVVALEAYLFAGVLFLRAAHRHIGRLPQAGLYRTLNTAPGVVLLLLYGAEVHGRPVYVGITLGGLLIAVASSVVLRRPLSRLSFLTGMWLSLLAAALWQTPRVVTYVLLALLYLMAALSFFNTMPRRSSGKIAVVSGFTMWALCFLVHPWVATLAPRWVGLAGEIWNMQKFLITVGFLVVLFEKQLASNEWMALHDPLTGLANRRLFQDRITNALARAERDRTALILFCMDLNDFKEVNDTLGHDAGDALLRNVALCLQRVVRRTDTLARLGGDEFTLLATDVKGARAPRKERRWRRGKGFVETADTAEGPLLADAAQTMHSTEHPVLRHANRIEQDIRSAINGPIAVHGLQGKLQVSVAVGVAVYPTDSTDIAELTRIADHRMYQDKQRQRAGRGGLDRVLSLLTTAG